MFPKNRKPKRDVVSSNLFELAVALLELPRRRNILAEAWIEQSCPNLSRILKTNIVNNFPNKHFQIVRKKVFDLKDKGHFFFLLNLFLKAEPDIYRKSFTTGNDKLS